MAYDKAVEVGKKFENKEITFRQALVELKKDMEHGAYYLLELMGVNDLTQEEYNKIILFLETYDDMKDDFIHIIDEDEEEYNKASKKYKGNSDERLGSILVQSKRFMEKTEDFDTVGVLTSMFESTKDYDIDTIIEVASNLKSIGCVRTKNIDGKCENCKLSYYECDYFIEYINLMDDIFSTMVKCTVSETERAIVFNKLLEPKNLIVDLLMLIYYYDDISKLSKYKESGLDFTVIEMRKIFNEKKDSIFNDDVFPYFYYKNYKIFKEYGAGSIYVRKFVDMITNSDRVSSITIQDLLCDKEIKLSKNERERLEAYLIINKLIS